MTRHEPTVSVAIPAYNAERFIAETIDSILAGTRQPLEIIVVNDGSTDRTLEIVSRYGDRVRVVSQPNQGQVAAYNRGFREAVGDFIAMCPADDLWEPRRLEWQLDTLTRHADVDIAFGHARLFGNVEGDYARPPGEGILAAPALTAAVFQENIIATPTVLIRRTLYERLGPFREDLASEDYEYYLRALRHGAVFHYDPRTLVRYRRHDGNLSSRLLERREMNYYLHQLYSADVGDARLVRRVLARDLLRIGRHRLDAGLRRDAARAYRRSLRYRATARGVAWATLLSLPGVAPLAHRLDTRRRRAASVRPAAA